MYKYKFWACLVKQKAHLNVDEYLIGHGYVINDKGEYGIFEDIVRFNYFFGRIKRKEPQIG